MAVKVDRGSWGSCWRVTLRVVNEVGDAPARIVNIYVGRGKKNDISGK